MLKSGGLGDRRRRMAIHNNSYKSIICIHSYRYYYFTVTNGGLATTPRRNRMLSYAATGWQVFVGQAIRVYVCDTEVVGVYSDARAEGLAVFYK